jgi:hypothetical protein
MTPLHEGSQLAAPVAALANGLLSLQVAAASRAGSHGVAVRAAGATALTLEQSPQLWSGGVEFPAGVTDGTAR